MIKKTHFLLIVLLASAVFISCKREVLHTNPKITNLTDYESNDGKVSLNISGGKAPYVIQWPNGSGDSAVSNLTAGTYYVTIADAKKSFLVDTIELTQPPWPVCVDIDGNSYKTRKVAGMTWMLENLKVTKDAWGDSVESLVYDNNEENADVYGRLYTWNSAMNDSTSEQAQGVCPDGWHIPSNEEWTVLIDNISTVDKEIPNVKKDLNLQYAGFYNNSFNNIDESVSFWTSTQASDNAWKVYFNKNLSKAFRYHEKRSNAISVRCVKNK